MSPDHDHGSGVQFAILKEQAAVFSTARWVDCRQAKHHLLIDAHRSCPFLHYLLLVTNGKQRKSFVGIEQVSFGVMADIFAELLPCA